MRPEQLKKLNQYYQIDTEENSSTSTFRYNLGGGTSSDSQLGDDLVFINEETGDRYTIEKDELRVNQIKPSEQDVDFGVDEILLDIGFNDYLTNKSSIAIIKEDNDFLGLEEPLGMEFDFTSMDCLGAKVCRKLLEWLLSGKINKNQIKIKDRIFIKGDISDIDFQLLGNELQTKFYLGKLTFSQESLESYINYFVSRNKGNELILYSIIFNNINFNVISHRINLRLIRCQFDNASLFSLFISYPKNIARIQGDIIYNNSSFKIFMSHISNRTPEIIVKYVSVKPIDINLVNYFISINKHNSLINIDDVVNKLANNLNNLDLSTILEYLSIPTVHNKKFLQFKILDTALFKIFINHILYDNFSLYNTDLTNVDMVSINYQGTLVIEGAIFREGWDFSKVLGLVAENKLKLYRCKYINIDFSNISLQFSKLLFYGTSAEILHCTLPCNYLFEIFHQVKFNNISLGDIILPEDLSQTDFSKFDLVMLCCFNQMYKNKNYSLNQSFIGLLTRYPEARLNTIKFLYNADLSRLDLSDIDLSGINFGSANFSYTNLTKTILKLCLFDGALFQKANLRDTDFSNSTLKKVAFNRSIMNRTNFTDCTYFEDKKTSFSHAKLEGPCYLLPFWVEQCQYDSPQILFKFITGFTTDPAKAMIMRKPIITQAQFPNMNLHSNLTNSGHHSQPIVLTAQLVEKPSIVKPSMDDPFLCIPLSAPIMNQNQRSNHDNQHNNLLIRSRLVTLRDSADPPLLSSTHTQAQEDSQSSGQNKMFNNQVTQKDSSTMPLVFQRDPLSRPMHQNANNDSITSPSDSITLNNQFFSPVHSLSPLLANSMFNSRHNPPSITNQEQNNNRNNNYERNDEGDEHGSRIAKRLRQN